MRTFNGSNVRPAQRDKVREFFPRRDMLIASRIRDARKKGRA